MDQHPHRYAFPFKGNSDSARSKRRRPKGAGADQADEARDCARVRQRVASY
jgi:hypothetical protein